MVEINILIIFFWPRIEQRFDAEIVKKGENIMAETATIELTWDEIDTIAQILWVAREEGLAEMLWDAGAELVGT